MMSTVSVERYIVVHVMCLALVAFGAMTGMEYPPLVSVFFGFAAVAAAHLFATKATTTGTPR